MNGWMEFGVQICYVQMLNATEMMSEHSDNATKICPNLLSLVNVKAGMFYSLINLIESDCNRN